MSIYNDSLIFISEPFNEKEMYVEITPLYSDAKTKLSLRNQPQKVLHSTAWNVDTKS